MTFSLETLIMLCSLTLVLGGLIGAVISRTMLPPTMQRDLEQRLNSSRDELERYQQDVARHFADTSKLVANLTHSYKEVHDHLAKGAMQLTNAEISKQIINAGDPKLGIEAKDVVETANFEPPRDWAPKSPGQKGTLSEEFGLEEHREEESIEQLTATRKLS